MDDQQTTEHPKPTASLADINRLLEEKRRAHNIDVNRPESSFRPSPTLAAALANSQASIDDPAKDAEREARRIRHEEWRKQQDAERASHVKRSFWLQSGCPKKNMDELDLYDFDGVMPTWRDVVSHAVDENGWLVFVGAFGTGKTQLATRIVWEWTQRKSRTALFTTAFRLCSEIKQGYGPDGDAGSIRERCGRCGLLVLDEFENRFDSPSEQLELHDIFNRRYSENLPTILISNLTPEAFAVNVGPAILDRLNHVARTVVFDWGSFRTK